MKNTFEKLLTICYDESSPQLASEVASIEENIKKTKDYTNGIEEVLEAVSIFSEDITIESQNKIQDIYEDSTELF